MGFAVGTKLGAYEIAGLLGAGGMGEVYRARDSKLKREVAIKVLPTEFTRDAGRVARFQREAEVLAQLNHPNIAAIYDIAEWGESRFLVLELVAGETIAERLSRGPIPLEEALAIATQIATALEAAHEKGIVHRDLKPANIKILPDGSVKVLDFGLAKAAGAESANIESLSNSPTLRTQASSPGNILGTAAYMPPEQAKGKVVDRTSDIWAFGCVLFEMLTGRPVFGGETVGEILAEVLKTEPGWNRLPEATPQPVRRLLRRCLQKDRKQRLQHIGDARIELEDIARGPAPEASVEPTLSRRKERLVWVSALSFVTLMAGAFALWNSRPDAPEAELRLDVITPATSSPQSLAISPDGQKLAYAAISETGSHLWVRYLDSSTARVLENTLGATFPFWSPDSRSIGFFADAQLKVVDTESGSVQILAKAPLGRGGAWNREGTILFAPFSLGPLYRVSVSGGEASLVTQLETGQAGHRFPQFLPDGRHFLYYAYLLDATAQNAGVYVGDAGGGSSPRRLLGADAAAVYAARDHLLFVRERSLYAQTFDVGRLSLTGSPFRVVENVAVSPSQSVAAVSASPSGMIVFRQGSQTGRPLVWMDRSGKEIEKLDHPELDGARDPAISRDGRHVILSRVFEQNVSLWLMDASGGVPRPFAPENASFPVWSPDGHIAYRADRNPPGIYRKSAAGGSEELLLENTGLARAPQDWSPDGRFLLYRTLSVETLFDVFAIPFDQLGKPLPPVAVIQSKGHDKEAQFSPDGKWIAYQSDRSGRFEIYIQPFPASGGEIRISRNGGAQVRWRADGKELFYIGLDNWMMAVPMQFESGTVEAGAPVRLFPSRIFGGAVPVETQARQQYVVSPDGQRFLVKTFAEEAASAIRVLVNWKPRS